MSRPFVVSLIALAMAAIPSPARAHGASRGMHLHLAPDTAAPGTTVEAVVDAAGPLVGLRIGFVGEKPAVIVLEKPAKRTVVKLTVPLAAKPGATINIVAEGRPESGKVVRASAILRLAARPKQ